MAVNSIPISTTAPVQTTRPRRRIPWAPILFLAIPMTIYVIWIIGPMIGTAFLSFTNWEGVGSMKFIGLSNYDRLFRERDFAQAFWNNVRWLAFFMVIPTSAGLAMAMIFNGNFPGSRVFKIAFYSPLVIAPSVVALIWEKVIYLPDHGMLDGILRVLGITQSPGWLANRDLVLWCIIFAAAWRQVGYVMILYLAGLKNLDVTLLEAAIVDGATPLERFRFVIFPLLSPVTIVVVVISVIDSLRAFDLVAVMTRGQPAGASQVLANLMYIEAFNNYKMGYAAAVGVVLLIIMLVFIIPYLAYTARNELEY